MKYKMLAVSVSMFILSSANAAEMYNNDGNKLDVYGKVDVRHYISNSKVDNNGKSQDGDDSRVRLGFKGESQITENLVGFGRFEWETRTNKTERDNENFNRLAFAGLKFGDNLGSIDYGRNYGVIYDTNAWTDVLPLWGADEMAFTDNFMTGRNRNLLTYRNNNAFGYVDGLRFALQYQGKNTENNKSGAGSDRIYKDNGDGYGISTSYDLGWGVTLGGGYSNSARTESQKTQSGATGDRAQAWNVGGKFDANNVYLAAMYGETLNMTPYGSNTQVANKTKNIELVAQYLFEDFNLKPSLAYIQSKGYSLNTWRDQDLVKYISVGSTYYFNKNMSAVVDYKINLLKDNNFTESVGLPTDNIVGLGLTYQF